MQFPCQLFHWYALPQGTDPSGACCFRSWWSAECLEACNVDVGRLGGNDVFHHLWNIFSVKKLKIDVYTWACAILALYPICRYSIPYLYRNHSFLQCALYEDPNSHYSGCFQYLVHSDLVEPFSAAAFSSNLATQVMRSQGFVFYLRSLAWRWIDMDGYGTSFRSSGGSCFLSIEFHWILSKACSEAELSRFRLTKHILSTCWMNDSNIFRHIQVMI